MVAIVTTFAAAVTTPHFAWPFRLGQGHAFAVVEQDTVEDIEQCVVVLVSTELGSREELPEYGISDPTFTSGVDTTEILAAVDDWEDRAVIELRDGISTRDDLRHDVAVSVRTGDA
jgi:phage baseplate assembly protein W